MHHADISYQQNQFYVSGELNFSNVMSVYAKSMSQLSACPQLHFDFSQVKASDSSGLALILEWLMFAKKNKKPIHFSAISNDLLSIAKVAGLEQLILNQA